MSETAPLIARRVRPGGASGLLPALVRRVLTVPRDGERSPDAVDPAADRPASGPPARSSLGTARHVLAGRWQWVALAPVLLLAAFLNLYRLSQEGNANQYYTATVFSMIQNWHAFLFASFDSAGFVTVDKPPLGFWIQAASAKLFGLLGLGFSGIAVLLPEALAGVASVALLFCLVRRACGPVPGLLAALALAVTPVSVAVSRNNTIDALLVMTLLLATWAAFIATERGSLRWLLVAAATIGLGFEIRMLQAFLVLPALWGSHLLWAPVRLGRRLAHLALATVALIVVSFAWPVIVDLTPPDARPFVGSSGSNSALSMALGYNGLGRVTQALAARLPIPWLAGLTVDLTVTTAASSSCSPGGPSWGR